MAKIYDSQTEFSADLAAKLIAGAADRGSINLDSYLLTLRALANAYRSALTHYERIHDQRLDSIAAAWTPPPVDTIRSTDMLRCARLLYGDPRGATFSAWLALSPTSFEQQTFDREEIGRWLAVMALPTKYPFIQDVAPPLTPKPVQRSIAQDTAILRVIEEFGWAPQALPKNPRGKPGAKAKVREELAGTSLFPYDGSVFKHAWERLMTRGEIAVQK